MHSVEIEELYRNESRKVFATLIRLLGDFDLAEEATHEAFAAAMQQWPQHGLPDNPASWLVSTGRFRAVDTLRRRAKLNDLQPELSRRLSEIEAANHSVAQQDSHLVEQALRSRRFGVYSIQAAISAVHAEATVASETDWAQIVALYDVLFRADESPVVELNRAVAIAMRVDIASGLAIIDSILNRGDLQDYYLAHSARGEFLRRLGNKDQAKLAFEQALSLARLEPERRFLRNKIASTESF